MTILPSRHFSPTKIFLDSSSKTALVLNPKVLTTFTRRLLADGMCEFRGRTDPSEGRWPFWSVARRFPVAPVRDYISFLRQPDVYAVYAFVRNPYDRMASAWKNKFLDGHHRSPDGATASYPRSIRQKHIRPLRAHAARLGLEGSAEKELVPFGTFLSYVATQPEGKRDHHWDTQERVLMFNQLPYKTIFRIEDQLAEGLSEITERIGFPQDWLQERLGTKINPSKRSGPAYSAELAKQVEALSGRDFDLFGYDPGSWKAD